MPDTTPAPNATVGSHLGTVGMLAGVCGGIWRHTCDRMIAAPHCPPRAVSISSYAAGVRQIRDDPSIVDWLGNAVGELAGLCGVTTIERDEREQPLLAARIAIIDSAALA